MTPCLLIKDGTASCFKVSIKYAPEHIHHLHLKNKNLEKIGPPNGH